MSPKTRIGRGANVLEVSLAQVSKHTVKEEGRIGCVNSTIDAFLFERGPQFAVFFFPVLAPFSPPRRGLPPHVEDHLRTLAGLKTGQVARPILVARPGKPKGSDRTPSVRLRGGGDVVQRAQVKGASKDIKALVSPGNAGPLREFLIRTFAPKGEWKHLHIWRVELV